MKRKIIPKTNSKLVFLGILLFVAFFLFSSSFFSTKPIELQNPHVNNQPENKPSHTNSSLPERHQPILSNPSPSTLEESIVNSAKSFVVTTYRPDKESYSHHFLGHDE